MPSTRQLLVVILWPALALAGENWPEFRGPTADGHSDSVGVPLTWSETENVAWKTPIHDRGWSSPVVWGTQVWLTTATEDGRKLFADDERAIDHILGHDAVVVHRSWDDIEPVYARILANGDVFLLDALEA